MTLAVCTLIAADGAFTFAAFFGSMTHRKEQTHYHANSRTIAVQKFKLLYWFVHKHGCAHTASKLQCVYNGVLVNIYSSMLSSLL